MRVSLGILTLILIQFGSCAVPTNGFKILMISPFESKSMRNVFMPLGKGLVSRGHDVTMIGIVPVQPGEDLGGVKMKPIPGLWDYFLTYDDDMYGVPLLGTSVYLERFFRFVLRMTDVFLETETTQELLDTPENEYDLVIINGLMGEFALPFVDRLAPYKVLLLPPDMLSWVAHRQGIPNPYSFVPFTLLDLPTKMNFFQRALNTWTNLKVNFQWKYFVVPGMNRKIQERFPGLPTIEEVQKQVSLVLVNAEPALRIAKPTVPYVVEIGGMHCRQAKPLDKTFTKLLDEVGEDGFIVFSLGSILRASLLPPEVKQKLLNVFSRLKQTILWKYEDEIEELPKNVKIFKWLPQQDLLGHPKIRLLITHCGLISLQEAVYHGVPVLGIPVFAEQPGNLARIVERGLGIKLDITDFSEESMFQSIQELLTDKRYQEASRNYSSISRDQMNRPVDRAVYWLEYVIRHAGAPHLKPAGSDLNFCQYFLLDIIGAIIVGVLLLFFTFLTLTKLLVNLFTKNGKAETKAKESSKKKKKKTN